MKRKIKQRLAVVFSSVIALVVVAPAVASADALIPAQWTLNGSPIGTVPVGVEVNSGEFTLDRQGALGVSSIANCSLSGTESISNNPNGLSSNVPSYTDCESPILYDGVRQAECSVTLTGSDIETGNAFYDETEGLYRVLMNFKVKQSEYDADCAWYQPYFDSGEFTLKTLAVFLPEEGILAWDSSESGSSIEPESGAIVGIEYLSSPLGSIGMTH